MNAQQMYFDDPYQMEFDAQICQVVRLADGRTGLVLDQTYFYPTGGGQGHDLGMLTTTDGLLPVQDVLKDKDAGPLELCAGQALPDGATIHVVDHHAALGPTHGQIDTRRRLRHMQHHTAQHLLTSCFARLTGLETASANINGDSPSTLDLAGPEPLKAQLDEVENLANAEIAANYPVRTYFATPEELARLPLRKPPSVSENIRIVGIDRRDYSPCGGTHVSQTGGIGVVKIVRVEKLKDKTRIHFIAGEQAFETFRSYFDIVTGIASGLSIHPQELTAAVERMNDSLRAAQKELSLLRQKLIPVEAQELLTAARLAGERRLVLARFDNRPPGELRLLAQELRAAGGIVAVLGSYDGSKLSLVTACSPDSGVDAGALLRRLLVPLNGRGGGDPTLAQGGGVALPAQVDTLFGEASQAL